MGSTVSYMLLPVERIKNFYFNMGQSTKWVFKIIYNDFILNNMIKNPHIFHTISYSAKMKLICPITYQSSRIGHIFLV